MVGFDRALDSEEAAHGGSSIDPENDTAEAAEFCVEVICENGVVIATHLHSPADWFRLGMAAARFGGVAVMLRKD